MALLKGYKHNFQTLLAAAENGDAVLLECTDKKTGEMRAVIAAVEYHKGDPEPYHFVPLAKMFDGNPYEEVNPPT